MIPIIKITMDEREVEAARRVILSGWLTQGPEVEAFEKEFAAYVGAPHACAVSNCTCALHLALKVLGVKAGDEVITVSHSFLATANCIRYLDAIPVFADIEPGTRNLDARLVDPLITPRTRAILCVHQAGMPCDLAAILEVGRRRGLPVVEDAAPAAGSEILWKGEWQKIGRPHGDIACFSFHPRKVIAIGDGGMITTANADYDRKFRLWRQHGMDIQDTARHGARSVAFEQYVELGYNYRMTDLQAAVGRVQLSRLPHIVSRRRAGAARYLERLRGAPGLELPEEPAWARSNWQTFSVGLPDGVDQRVVMQKMLDAGIATRRGIHCSHMEPCYEKEPWFCGVAKDECQCPPQRCKRLKNSERARLQGLILPLYTDLSEADQDRVIETLAQVLDAPRA